MNHHTHRRLGLTVGVLAALVAAACGGDDGGGSASDGAAARGATTCDEVDLTTPPDQPVTIRMGHGPSTEDPLYVQFLDPEVAGAQYYGDWYTIEATQFEPPDRLAAYQAGDLDAGTISTPQLLTAAGSDIPIVAVASIAVVSEGGFAFPYLALDDSGIDSIEDLDGRSIGIIAPNTATEYWALSAVARAGLDPQRDVELVSVPPPSAEQTLRGGQVDVAMMTEAFAGPAEQAGGVHEVFDALTGPGFDHELLDVFFAPDFIADNPEAFCAWRADYQAAMASFLDDPTATGEVLIDNDYDAAPDAEAYAARPQPGREAEGRIDLANVDRLIDDMKATGFLPEDLPVTAD
ncbi:MAG: ABC transporter substrate-binding protein, partial [Acidimicrobiales bacterium]